MSLTRGRLTQLYRYVPSPFFFFPFSICFRRLFYYYMYVFSVTRLSVLPYVSTLLDATTEWMVGAPPRDWLETTLTTSMEGILGI